MGVKNLLTLVVLLVLYSCVGDSSELNAPRKTRPPRSILNLKVFNTEAEKMLSFPMLFDNQLIHQQGIKKVTRCLFLLDKPRESRDLSTEVLREKKEYFFNDFGRLIQIDFTYFFDDRVVGKQRIRYPNTINYYGYSSAVLHRDSGAVIQEKAEIDVGFRMHHLVKKNRRYLALEDQKSGEVLFYMLNKKYWGALSVDSILEPRPIDRVVLGSPHFPFKSYRVENKVKEKDVVEYHYKKDSKQIKRIVSADYPFNSTRTFIYRKSGYCYTYIDSTFSGEEYLARTITKMDFDAQKRPVKVRHIKETGFRKLGIVSLERITYE
jgi:hypothetical protein